MKKGVAYLFLIFFLLVIFIPLKGYAQVLNPANGHYYELVTPAAGAPDWNQAMAAAAAMTFNGVAGHLATITSAQENAFIISQWPALDAHIGGTDAAVEGTFQWITGETWLYTNWNAGEPNDAGGNEDCLEIFAPVGLWNDIPCSGFTNPSYLVEYDFALSVPTMNQWGMIIFMVLAGIASIYYMRRRRKTA
jgi:hypothetical protein